MIGASFTYLLDKLDDGRYYKTQYSLDHANEDIIIIGSSRGETNYNPSVFTKFLFKETSVLVSNLPSGISVFSPTFI